MLNKLSSLMLILLLIGPVAGPHAYGKDNKDQKSPASKVKQKVSKIGVDTPVIVKLNDGRMLGGRIRELDEDSFALLVPVKEDRTARLTDQIVIAYSEVRQVKDDEAHGANMLPGFLIAGAVILMIKVFR